MENIYKIKYYNKDSTIPWNDFSRAEIGCFLWDQNGYNPESFAMARYSDRSIDFKLKAFEKEIKADYEKMNDPVYEDSCLEVFIQPDPVNDARYLNFEFNSRGTILLGIGSSRYDRILFDEGALKYFKINAFIKPYGDILEWGIEFHIPIEFFHIVYPGFELNKGKLMKGNFYKCGDKTHFPHYGCWNQVISDFPDFHRPECFGTLLLE